MPLNTKQVEQLLRPINPKRVQRDRSGNSHLAGYDVSAHLTRIFGFGGWEKHIRSLELVSEDSVKEGQRTGWWVTYRCLMTLDVKDPSGAVIWSGDDGATGSASNLPARGDAHDFAMKNAITYALKRCAKDLGDQFGLSLYNKGSLAAIVGRVLAAGDGPGDVESAIEGEIHPDADDIPPGGEPQGAGDAVTPAEIPAASPAQILANQAAAAATAAELEKVQQEAEHGKHLTADVIDPATGSRGKLAGYIEYCRRGLAAQGQGAGPGVDAEAAWVASFMEELSAMTSPADLGAAPGKVRAAKREGILTAQTFNGLMEACNARRQEITGSGQGDLAAAGANGHRP